MVRKVRDCLKPYAEIFYMLYFLPLAGCVALNISSSQLAYRVVFVISAIFLLMKLFVTDYSEKEIVLMIAFLSLLGYVFFRTSEKTLIITAMSIFGCKGVNVRQVLKYTFFVYIIGMGIMISLVLLGKVEGEIHHPMKNGIIYNVNDFGYSQPNSAYNHLLMIVFMAVAIWEKKMLWYHYLMATVVMFIAYNVFKSRTGLLVYILLCAVLLVLFLIKQMMVKKVFCFFVSLLPLVIAISSYALVALFSRDIMIINKLDNLVNGRIRLPSIALTSVGLTWFGANEKTWVEAIEKTWVGEYYLDNVYMNILISCGIIVCIICVLSYFFMCYHYWKIESYYVLLLLGIMTIYMFMEYAPVNATWNPLLLFMVESIFRSTKDSKTGESSLALSSLIS